MASQAPPTQTKHTADRYTAFKEMTRTEKLLGIPLSGEYEEIIFDLPEPWRGQAWNYVKFTTTEGSVWCGEFREKQNGGFLISELPDIGVACVVSGGHGFIIDINKKEKIKDLDTEPIIDIYADKDSNTFYVSSYWDLHLIDNELNEVDLPIPIGCDGIFFKGADGRILSLEIEEIGADMTKNIDYHIDLNEKKIKKNAV